MSSRELPPFIARYEIQATLGQGAMGTVYRARDPQLDRMVAIKTVRNDLGLSEENFAAFKMRFFQEAKAAGRLNHPNIVAFYDVMEVEHTPYIVMEYVESDTLANLIKARGAPHRPGRRHHATDLSGPRLRARPWHRAPRHQARQYPHRHEGAR